jgi:hypothetical protein
MIDRLIEVGRCCGMEMNVEKLNIQLFGYCGNK